MIVKMINDKINVLLHFRGGAAESQAIALRQAESPGIQSKFRCIPEYITLKHIIRRETTNNTDEQSVPLLGIKGKNLL